MGLSAQNPKDGKYVPGSIYNKVQSSPFITAASWKQRMSPNIRKEEQLTDSHMLGSVEQ